MQSSNPPEEAENITENEPTPPTEDVENLSKFKPRNTKKSYKTGHYSREELITKAQNVERVGGVCFDKNRQRWIAHWKINGKYVKNYFPVSNYGFEGARDKAIKCRKDAEVKHNLPEIQTRQERRPKTKRTPSVLDEQLAQRPAETFYDDPQDLWVTMYSVYEVFPVDKFGFAEAKRKALNCKKNHETPLRISEGALDEFFSPVKCEHKGDDSSTEYDFHLTKQAIKIVIENLKNVCLKSLNQLFKYDEEEYDSYFINLELHKKRISNATNQEQLLPYIALFGDCIIEHLLPFDKPEEYQLNLIKELKKII